MSKMPTKAEILDWMSAHPTQTSKREIAKAFGIKGAARIDLKQLLKELEAEGHIEKRKKTYSDPDRLPPVSVLEVQPPNDAGDLFAKPLEWHGEGVEPIVLVLPRASDPALGAGDRILARLTVVHEEDHNYEARLIRKIGRSSARRVIGIFRKTAEGGRIVPVDKAANLEWAVPEEACHGAKDGELVEAEQSGPKGRMGLPRARILDRIGDPSAPKAVSLIAIHQHGIPDDFPDSVLSEADAAKPMGLSGREDLRDLPLVTIDPSDARDHDDAVFAQPDDAPGNPGGHILWVAIADVAAYVTPGSQLDREARKRGNSTYFPDRVVPMLPDRLSGDLCSLHEGVPRPCIAVAMTLDKDGNKISHRFVRGLMRSAASLSYEEVQSAIDGAPGDKAGPLLDPVLKPLYAAYDTLVRARDRRQPLDLDLPERRVELTEDGRVKAVRFRDRLTAHRVIEEAMVLANVAAAETLLAKRQPLLFRVHEEPDAEKIDALRNTAQASGFALAKGQVLKTAQLNRLLHQAAGTEEAELINMATLRSMSQAYYNPENFGHFGLALKNYAHFTSPIRRYSDLIVHRALVTAHGWGPDKGKDGLSEAEIEGLKKTAEHISDTERRSMMAERDTTDRYLAAYLSERVGDEMEGRINGIARFGVFVKLDDSGADGLVPIRSLGNEYFHFDREAGTLMGSDTGRIIALGQRATVRLVEAEPVTGGLELELLTLDDEAVASVPGGRRRRPGTSRRPMGAKASKSKTGASKGRTGPKTKRKVTRRRR